MILRSHFHGFAFWIALIDLIALVTGSAVAVVMRIGHDELYEYIFGHLNAWTVYFGSIILANYLAGSYRLQHSFSRFNVVVTWLFSMLFSVLALSFFSYAWLFKVLLGRGILLLSMACYSVLSLALKMIAYRTLFTRDFFLCRTVIAGVGPRAVEMQHIIENKFVLPVHKVIAFVDVVEEGEKADIAPGAPVINGVAVINSSVRTFEDIIRNMRANLVVTVFSDRKKEKGLYSHLRRLRFEGIEVFDTFGVVETYLGKTPIDLVDEDVMTRVAMESSLPMVKRAKRLVDIVTAFICLVLGLPLILIIAALVKVSEPRGRILYSQLRVGQFGKVFRMYKFRTMREGAEMETGPVWSSVEDTRITWLGRILRRFRLDEIPQLYNVLRGEMSIVGPRPERPELHAQLEKKIPFFAERLNVPPGLTGWAQVRYPYGNTFEDAARKLEYDFYYIKYLSFSLDLQIVLRTIRIITFGMERDGRI